MPPSCMHTPLTPRPWTTAGGFRGAFGFLSNAHPSPVTYLGRTWATAEEAYFAQRGPSPQTPEAGDRPQAAWAWAPFVSLHPAWDKVAMAHMRAVLMAKFTQHPGLRERLLATEGVELVHHNTDGDPFWGVSSGVGLNWLGRFLMDLRSMLAEAEPPPPPATDHGRHLLHDVFSETVRSALVLAERDSATEHFLLRRIREGMVWNRHFDLPREERELLLMLRRLKAWRTPMDTPHPLLHVTTDEARGTWTARADLQGPGGVCLETREAGGSLEPVEVLRPDKAVEPRPERVPVTEAGLLGTALAAALELAEGWEGPRILQADARQNGLLKVTLHDWVREGRLEAGDAAFAHGREAWGRVLEALRGDPPRLRVRWTPSGGC